MICRNCNREVPENAQICPFCGGPVQAVTPNTPAFIPGPEQGHQPVQQQSGYFPQQPGQPAQMPWQPVQPSGQTGQVPQQPVYGGNLTPAVPQFTPGGFPPKQPSKNKTRWIIVGSIAGFLVVAGIVLAGVLGWYYSPAQVFDRAIEAEDYETAGSKMDSLDYGDWYQAVEQFTALAEDAYWDYNMDEASYEEAEALLNRLYSCCPEQELEDILDDLAVLRESKINFEKGASAEAAGKYREAISQYQLVIEEDFLYDEAEEKAETQREPYKQEIIQRAKALAEEEQYNEASYVLLASQEILQYDPEIDSLLKEYQEKGFEKARDVYRSAGKYKTIEDFVKFESPQPLQEQLNEKTAWAGVSVNISGQGNKLIYTCVLNDLYDMDKEVLGDILGEALDENGNTFESIAVALKLAVEVENPVVVVRYVTKDGTELCSREFAAQE